MDVDQCDSSGTPDEGPMRRADETPTRPVIRTFRGTHKCENHSTQCHFIPGNGWDWGSYECRCRKGFYMESPAAVSSWNGTLLEVAWRQTAAGTGTAGDGGNQSLHWARAPAAFATRFSCRPCAPGCDSCVDPKPCLASYNWVFRTILLIFSMFCVGLTLFCIGYVYNYRHLKIFKIASPVFLCITLVGCGVMYLEMAAIFPILDTYACVATKWTRHFGFCMTYSALLMKTWRVSMTYRVTSAHKVKLTDNQLLQWLIPILLIMGVYLSAWTVSSPPPAVDIQDSDGLRFKQCAYNWWDHCLALGEIVFLAWGIKVCLEVRNAESYLNEARYISYAIYNIASVNIFMLTLHLLIFPNAGPDIKYLFGFVRTQLSTSTTIVLVFFPKIYRVMRGLGDVHDNRARAKGVTASFSLNGIGCAEEEIVDVYQENEELKEELQKLAGQIEYMKIVQMQKNNPHLRPRPGSYFNPQVVSAGPPCHSAGGASTPSAGRKPSLLHHRNRDDTHSVKMSPAAELLSDKV